MKIKAFLAAAALAIGITAIPAFAATPSYQVIQNGATAQISITGTDVNAPVVLYYYPQNTSTVASAGMIGTTNASGYFTTTVTSSTYSIPSGSNTYVTVAGNPSATQPWPYFTGGTSGSVTLSQTSLSMSIGQNSSVAIYGGNAGYYISSNSNSGIANAVISGSQLSITAQNAGSTTIVVCSSGSAGVSSSCANLYVTVGGTNGTTLVLNQTNVTLSVGQVSLVSAQNSSSASLFVSSNSNPNVVTATASGNAIYLTANTPGYATVSVCNSTGYSSCGTVNVTVNYSYNTIAQSVTLAENSTTVNVGQSQQVAIYGSGSYSIASNSNPNIVSASVVGNSRVIVQGVNPGNATLSICSNQYGTSQGGCASLYVTSNGTYVPGYIQPTYVAPISQPYYLPASSYIAPAHSVYLSQVPYTGLADDAKLFAFIAMLVAFSGIGAYIIVGKKVFA